MSAAVTNAKARQPLRPLPVTALGLAALAVVLAMLAGPGDRGDDLRPAIWWVGLPLALAGLALAVEVLRRAMLVARAGSWRLLALTALGLGVIGTAGAVVGSVTSYVIGWAFLLAVVGLALVFTALPELAAGEGTPWQRLSAADGLRSAGVVRLLGGAWLLLIALYLVAQVLQDLAISGASLAVLAILLLGGFGVALGGGTWAWARAQQAAGRPPRGGPATTRDEQTIAAHLHDSVLQTLSLIQRNAEDPARVAQLARQQERSLRAWLAGRDEASGSTLAGAVRLAAQEVEDEQPGAVIEVVAVGDAPLDRESDALVRAAREAMRNAVRHAGSPVRVFVEVEAGVRELFVRDTGAGFDLDAVADERRGVRDAIIGRMEHVGGSAAIDSGPGGTEVALKVPA